MKRKKYFAFFLVMTLCFCGSTSSLLAQAKQTKAMITLGKLSAEFEGLSKSVSPAIVQILATGYVPGMNQVSALTKQRSTGSGVLLDANGFIVTNAHVVEGARRVQVALNVDASQNGRKGSILKPRGDIVGAQIVGIDRETDLAVLKVNKTNLPFMKLGDSDTVEKGQLVLAFGSPLGLENSVTMGVVSSIARQLRPEDRMIYIQTDAPINPGNSGGPLVDTHGNVIGINTLIFSQSGGSEGIGFAAPSNIVQNVYAFSGDENDFPERDWYSYHGQGAPGRDWCVCANDHAIVGQRIGFTTSWPGRYCRCRTLQPCRGSRTQGWRYRADSG